MVVGGQQVDGGRAELRVKAVERRERGPCHEEAAGRILRRPAHKAGSAEEGDAAAWVWRKWERHR
eukprot:7384368-Prymnesium_polylepis.1